MQRNRNDDHRDPVRLRATARHGVRHLLLACCRGRRLLGPCCRGRRLLGPCCRGRRLLGHCCRCRPLPRLPIRVLQRGVLLRETGDRAGQVAVAGHISSGPALSILHVHIGVQRQELLDDDAASIVRRVVQGRPSHVVAELDEGARVQQRDQDVDMTVAGGQMQWRLPALVGRIDLSTRRQQPLYDGHTVDAGALVQGGVPVGVGPVDGTGGDRVQKHGSGLVVAHHRRQVQRRRREPSHVRRCGVAIQIGDGQRREPDGPFRRRRAPAQDQAKQVGGLPVPDR